MSNEVSEIVCEHPSSVSSSSTGSNTASSMPSGEKQEINRSGVIPVPTVSFNAVYQLCHIYRHLFDEGIGLRQLLDYYFVLKALEESKQTSKEEIMYTLSRFGMAKFAGAAMYVLQTVFAMPNEYLICEPNETEGRFLLNEIMLAGNFGKYDERIKKTPSIPLLRGKIGMQLWHAIEKTKHNLRLLSHYPEEVLCEPFFRVYHWMWRKLELWKW